MESVRVELWYTDDLMAEYGFTERSPKYTLVHSYEDEYEAMYAGDYGEMIAENAFQRFNADSGPDRDALNAKQLRSLSMGDIVKIVFDDGTEAWCCATVGFRPIESWEVADG